MKPVRTLIVIADGAKAFFYQNDGVGKGLTSLDKDMTHKVPRSHEIDTDRPGRSFQSFGSARSSMEPRTDPHELEETRFAGSLIDRIKAALDGDEADRVIIAADPQTLGEMRKAMPKSLAAKLTGTLDKDLTKTPVAQLAKHLEGLIAL